MRINQEEMWYNEVNTAKYISHTFIPLSVSLGTKAKQSKVFISTFQYHSNIKVSINFTDLIFEQQNCIFQKI